MTYKEAFEEIENFIKTHYQLSYMEKDIHWQGFYEYMTMNVDRIKKKIDE